MTLIDKIIQMQGSQLKGIPQSDSSVVVLADTKSFSVAKQNKAVFNILSPKKVVFMGLSNDQDPTTRAERREEELERRRRRSPLGSGVVGGGAIAAMTGRGGGREGDPYADQIDNAINKTSSLLKKIAELTASVMGLRVLLKGFGITIPNTGATGARTAGFGSKIAGLFRGLLKGGQVLFKGFVETVKFLTKKRSFAAGGRAVIEAARTGASGAARVVGNIIQGGKNLGRNLLTGGSNVIKNIGSFVKNLPGNIAKGLSKVKFTAKTILSFLKSPAAAKALLMGFKGSRILSTFGLSLVADHYAEKAAGVADKITAALEAHSKILQTGGMPPKLYHKLQFQKENKGKSASRYHSEKAMLLTTQHPAMREAYNAANPKNQLSEAEYIQQLNDSEKYVNPANNTISTFKSETFAGLAADHLSAIQGASGVVINPDRKGGLSGVQRKELTSPTGKPSQRRSIPFSPIDATAEQFMGTENDSIRGNLPTFQDMGQIKSDQLRIDAIEEMLRQLNPSKGPVIVNVNNGSNTNQSRTLFTDTSTRADDSPQLDAITTGGAAQVDFTQSWIGQ